MNNNRANRSIFIFLLLALGLSFLYWGLFLLHDHGLLPFDPKSDLMGAARGYGPSLAALVAATVIYGRDGLRDLWMRVTMWRIPLWLFALAIVGPMLISLALLVILQVTGVDLVLTSESMPIPKLVIVFFFFAIVDGPVGEEIGWRGFLLPRLLEKHGVLFASTVIGLVWFVWHIPLYIATDRYEMSMAFFATYLLNTMAFSFLHAWFFLRSGGSALLAITFHTAGNYSVFLAVTLFPSIEKSPTTLPIYYGILGVAAIFAGFSMWRNPAYRQFKLNDA